MWYNVMMKMIPGTPGYAITDEGKIYSHKTDTWLRAAANGRRDGHLHVCLYINGKPTTRKVSHLVLEAFVGPKPEGMEACHEDGNPANNCLSNLRWDTSKNNHADKKKHGTIYQGESHHNAKLTDAEVKQIREVYCPEVVGLSTRKAAGLPTQKEIANKYGVHQSLISYVVNGVWRKGA